jgi:hypothetical protein
MKIPLVSGNDFPHFSSCLLSLGLAFVSFQETSAQSPAAGRDAKNATTNAAADAHLTVDTPGESSPKPDAARGPLVQPAS